MTRTRAQQNQAAGRSGQQERNNDTEPDQTDERTTQGTAAPQTSAQIVTQIPSGLPLEAHNTTTPDVLDFITTATATISEEGKTIVNTIIKAMQLISNQKDKKNSTVAKSCQSAGKQDNRT